MSFTVHLEYLLKTILALFLTLLAGLAQPCLASDVTGKVTNLEIDSDIAGNVLFIMLDTPKTNPPTCQTNSWSFVMSLGDATSKNMYAMLLAAKAAQTPVRVRGIGQCSSTVWSSIETATGVGLP
jgi:hypothetical protein